VNGIIGTVEKARRFSSFAAGVHEPHVPLIEVDSRLSRRMKHINHRATARQAEPSAAKT